MKKLKILGTIFLLIQSTFLFSQELGETLFKNNCSVCHKLDKKLIGPPLKDIGEKYDQSWLVKFIKSSQTLIKKGDPQAVAIFNEYNKMIMPDQTLSQEEIVAVISYIITASKKIKEKAEEKTIISRPKVTPPPAYLPFYPKTSPLFWIIICFAIVLITTILYFIIILATNISRYRK